MQKTRQDELLEMVSRLTDEEQAKVLAFIHNLKPSPRELSGHEIVEKYAGSIPKEDLEEIAQAIEEAFGYHPA